MYYAILGFQANTSVGGRNVITAPNAAYLLLDTPIGGGPSSSLQRMCRVIILIPSLSSPVYHAANAMLPSSKANKDKSHNLLMLVRFR